MALSRPLVPTLLVVTGTLAAASPAHAGPSTYGKTWGDALGATVKKQLDPKTSSLTNITATLRAILGPADPACAAQETSKPFAQWKDNANYVPVPNSGFERGLETWSPAGPATVVDDNHAFGISGRADDRRSLVLPDGASVTSSSFCGGLEYPTIRMMARATNGRSAKAIVTVRYTGRDGLLAALPIGTVTAGPDWGPSEVTLTASGVPIFTGSKLGVTITGAQGSIAVDDVYVDPYRRN